MASLTIKVDLPQTLDTVLEAPDGMVIVIPATSAEVQAFGQTLSNALAFAQSQAKALHTMRKGFVAQGEVSAKLVAALDQLIAEAAAAEWFMLHGCQFMARAIPTSNLDRKGNLQ